MSHIGQMQYCAITISTHMCPYVGHAKQSPAGEKHNLQYTCLVHSRCDVEICAAVIPAGESLANKMYCDGRLAVASIRVFLNNVRLANQADEAKEFYYLFMPRKKLKE